MSYGLPDDNSADRQSRLFSFSDEAVSKAFAGDTAAFEKICVEMLGRFDAVKAKLRADSPGRPTEFYEKACDLFLDRVLRVFREPPSEAVRDFNALCGLMLKCSVRDAIDWFGAARRDLGLEIRGDAPVGEEADGATFFDFVSEDSVAAEVAGTPLGSADRIVGDIDRKELLDEIARALSKISNPVHRKAVRLWMNGCSEKEIAAATGLTQSNAGSVISRTIKKLRAELQEKGGLFRQ